VLKQAKAVLELIDAVGEAAGAKGKIADLLTPLTWTDDGEQNITVTLKGSIIS
jgi:hypothetical protein